MGEVSQSPSIRLPYGGVHPRRHTISSLIEVSVNARLVAGCNPVDFSRHPLLRKEGSEGAVVTCIRGFHGILIYIITRLADLSG